MSDVECIKCKYSLKEVCKHNKILSKKITCKNEMSKYYGKSFITNERNQATCVYDNLNDDVCNCGELLLFDNAKIKVEHIKCSLVIETDRDRFINLLNSSNSDTFETIVTEYIQKFGDTIPADQCCQIIQLLSGIQYSKISKLHNIKRVAREHATYLEKYLDGKMYNEENSFDKYREIQKKNAQTIIDVCDE